MSYLHSDKCPCPPPNEKEKCPCNHLLYSIQADPSNPIDTIQEIKNPGFLNIFVNSDGSFANISANPQNVPNPHASSSIRIRYQNNTTTDVTFELYHKANGGVALVGPPI